MSAVSAVSKGKSRYVPLLLVVAGLLAGVFIPAVNAPRLWLGFPSLLVWSVAGVALLTPALVLVEFGRRRRDHAEPDEGVNQ